jgi:NADH dehydrogenase subunit K (EC 1.6.5.3)
MIGLSHYLLVGAALFGLGLFGLLTKRNLIAVLMSIELMLNSVNINLVAFSRYSATDAAAGQVFPCSSSPSPQPKWLWDWRWPMPSIAAGIPCRSMR